MGWQEERGGRNLQRCNSGSSPWLDPQTLWGRVKESLGMGEPGVSSSWWKAEDEGYRLSSDIWAFLFTMSVIREREDFVVRAMGGTFFPTLIEANHSLALSCCCFSFLLGLPVIFWTFTNPSPVQDVCWTLR